MASDNETEPPNILEFRTWFSSNGGYIHPSVQFKREPSGLSVYAQDNIPADSQIISCPFSLAITPELTKLALSTLLKSPPALAKWTERQLICTYLCLHWVLGEGDSKPSTLPPVLAHLAYLHILPCQDYLRTPLQFTSRELDAFKGSNLYGATLDRKRDLEAEWQGCKNIVSSVDESWGTRFTLLQYFTVSTYLSSRAFPSGILSVNPSLQSTDSTYPVLLPGVDSLNHARATPVSWVVSRAQTSTPTAPTSDDNPKKLAISLVLHTQTPASKELFNNYGPKPNSELILGYGFALPANPSDTIVLQVGGGGATPSHAKQGERKKFEIGRDAVGADLLWDEVLSLATVHSDPAENTYEDNLEGARILGDMLLTLFDRLPKIDSSGDLRPEVQTMLAYYLEGQRDILQVLLEFARDKEQAAIEAASAEGIELVFEDAYEDAFDDADEL
jgi:hypothetical protein